MIFEAVQAVLMVVIIIAAGYFIARAGWAGKTVTDFISNLIVGVTLPCTAVMAFLTGFTAKTLADSWIYILASFAAIGVTWPVSYTHLIEELKIVGEFCYNTAKSFDLGLRFPLGFFNDGNFIIVWGRKRIF